MKIKKRFDSWSLVVETKEDREYLKEIFNSGCASEVIVPRNPNEYMHELKKKIEELYEMVEGLV